MEEGANQAKVGITRQDRKQNFYYRQDAANARGRALGRRGSSHAFDRTATKSTSLKPSQHNFGKKEYIGSLLADTHLNITE